MAKTKKPRPKSPSRKSSGAGKALILRTCNADMTSHGGFVWPKRGPVKCPDWDPQPTCGNGLHGLLWGRGNGALLNRAEDAVWLAVEVNTKDVVDIDGKVKFPRGRVVKCGARDEVVAYIEARTPADVKSSSAIVYGQATAGYAGKATAGNYGQATAGNYGQATAGNYGQATAGDSGQATAGYAGKATASYAGKATAGYAGKATAGNYGQATAGNYGQATAGDSGQATAGEKGIISLSYWDPKAERRRIVIGYVGEDGIEPDTTYRLDDNYKFEKVS